MPNDVVDALSRLCLCRAGCSQRRRRFLDGPDHGLWCGPAHASLRARLGLGLRFGGEELHVKFIESSECVHCGPDVHPGCTGSDCARSQVANGRPAVVGGSDRGHFEDILGKNLSSSSSSSSAGDDPSVPHEQGAPIPGLNNGQGGGKSGRWQWVYLPTIVIVAHLGELGTMRRWFGGSKYGFSINHYLMGSFLLLICLPTTAAVTCRTCFDQVPGCTGGNTCPFVATRAQNGMLLGGVAAATAMAIVARNVFPLRFTRILTRGVLEQLAYYWPPVPPLSGGFVAPCAQPWSTSR